MILADRPRTIARTEANVERIGRAGGLRSRALRRLVGAAALATSITLAGSAAADEAPGPLLVVTVPDLPGSDVDDRAAGTVAAHVREAGARVQVVRRTGPFKLRALLKDAKALAEIWSARAVIWIDVGGGVEAGVYLFERGTDRIFGRRIPAPSAQISAALESVANIAGTAAEDLLEGRAVALAPVVIASTGDAAAGALETATPIESSTLKEGGNAAGTDTAKDAATNAVAATATATPTNTNTAPRTPPPNDSLSPSPQASDAPLPWPRIALSAGYTGNTFGRGLPWQSAISLLASWELSRSAAVGLGYDVAFPQYIGDQHFNIRIQRHPAILSGSYRLPLSDSWDFLLGARLALDFVTLHPSSPPPPPPGQPPPHSDDRSPDDWTDVGFSVAPIIGLGVRITDRVRLGLMGGADVPLARLSRPGPFFIEPDPVRFVAGAAVQVDLVIPGAAAGASPASETRKTAAK